MSSPNKGDETKPKSVRFAANVSSRAVPARQREDDDDDDDHGRHKKRPRIERPNEDEADDVDDWEGEDDTEEGRQDTKELLEAKRKRRVRREGIDEEDNDTHIDASTSLLSDYKNDSLEVTVEPFNMDVEENDGSGYFDGDTYVFRKRDAEEEPDAWVESLADQKGNVASIPEKQDDKGTEMDGWTQEELYAKIIPLVSDTESVLQAVSRYGGLLKRHKAAKGANEGNGASFQMAQRALNDLTEAASALLLKGDVDVYQRTRDDFMKLIPDKKAAAAAKEEERPVVTWEYRGNQDREIHGPYTTAQLKCWIQAGYFVGEQAVQIRTISKEESKSTVDDLLSDLMDDDEEDGQTEQVKGEWKSSNDVDFSAYA
jgi:CD2 antigen cytoplasmic tail-binding protein 2